MLPKAANWIVFGSIATALAFGAMSPDAARAASIEQRPAEAPLADRIPANTLVYAGWAGTDSLGEDFAGTHAGALCDAGNLRAFFEQFLPSAAARLAEDDLEARQVVEVLSEVLPLVARRPTAIAFGGIEWAGDPRINEPAPRLLLMIEAGGDGPALRARIAELFAASGRPELALFLEEHHGTVFWSIGYSALDLAALHEGDRSRSLAAAERFEKAMTGLADRPLKAAYLDFPGIYQFLRDETERNEGPQQAREFEMFVHALGLDGLGAFAFTSGFEERSFTTAAFLGTTGERRGLLRMLDGPALDTRTLAAIPADASTVIAGRFEPVQLLELAREMVRTFAPEQANQVELGLFAVNMMLGANIEQGVLRQAGPTWAAYTSPFTGEGAINTILVNRPQDAALLRRSLANATASGLAMLDKQVRENTDGEVRLRRRQVRLEGLDIHLVQLPAVAPSWAVAEQHAFFALLPQSIAAGKAWLDENGDGFDTSAGWQKARELAGGNEVLALSYLDLPRLADRGYPTLLVYSQLATGFGDMMGLDAPAAVLPPYHVLRRHLEPAVSVAWVDDSGLRFRSTQPFPLSKLLAGDAPQMVIGGGAMGIGMTLPALNRAREAANRVQSANNLRMIGMAARQYAIEQGRGRLPADIQELYHGTGLGMEVFISPRTGTRPPDMIAQAIEVQAAWVQEHGDYVYIGGLQETAGADVLLAYERPERVTEGINMLFADGHVRFVRMPEALRIIERGRMD